MADFGVGEAAAAEGAKGASEAVAAEGALGAGAEGLGAAELGAGALGAEGLGEAALGGGAAGFGTEALADGAFGLGEGAAGAQAAGTLGDVLGATPLGEAGVAGAGADGITALPFGDLNAAQSGGGFGGGFGGEAAVGGDAALPVDGAGLQFETTADTAISNPAATGGGSGFFDSTLKSIKNNPLNAAALGLTAANLAGASSAAKKGTPAQLNALGDLTAGPARDLIAEYQSGKINPGDEFNINQNEQQQIAQVRSQFAKSGQSNSTAERAAIAKIQQQAQAMREQARKGLLDEGLKAAGLSQGPLMAAIQAQAQQDAQLRSSQSSALQSLMLLQAINSRGTPAPVVTGGT